MYGRTLHAVVLELDLAEFDALGHEAARLEALKGRVRVVQRDRALLASRARLREQRRPALWSYRSKQLH